MFWLLGFCCKTSILPWLLPDFFGAAPQSNLRLPSGLKSSENSPNKTWFSTLRLCIYFSPQFWWLWRDPKRLLNFTWTRWGPVAWCQQRPLGPIRLFRDSRGIWVSVSWFLNLLLLADDPKFYSVVFKFSRGVSYPWNLSFKKRYLCYPQRKMLGRFLLSLHTERFILSWKTGMTLLNWKSLGRVVPGN